MPDRTTTYLIWSHAHSGFRMSGERGYSANLFYAGTFDAADAERICAEANAHWTRMITNLAPPEIAVPLPESFTTRGIDDVVDELRASIHEATAAAIEARRTARQPITNEGA